MGFYDVLDQILDLLRRRGRVTYRALKREFPHSIGFSGRQLGFVS